LANVFACEKPRSVSSVVIFGLLAFAAFEFGVRGPWRALHPAGDFNDFLSPYVQARIWLSGGDPYDARALVEHWPRDIATPDFLKREAMDGSLARLHGVPSPYPITAFSLLVPVALLPWRIANLFWLGFEILSFLVLLVALLHITKAYVSKLRASLLVLAILPLAPIHTAFSVENIVIVAIALGTAAVLLEEKGYGLLAAVLLACGTAVKPTVALPFIGVFILRRRWGSLLCTAALFVSAFLVAEIRMIASGTQWLASFLAVNWGMFSPGGVNDFSSANPIRFDLVNLQVVLSQFVTSPQLAQYLSITVTLIALLLWLWFRRRVPEQPVLLDVAIASLITLLPVYHRFYDASLLIFAVAWAVTELRGTASIYAWICLAGTLPFMVPGAAALNALVRSSALIAAVSRGWWWNMFVGPHQVWLIAAMLVALLLAQRKLRHSEIRIPSVVPAVEAA
jgi:hypothetical protein